MKKSALMLIFLFVLLWSFSGLAADEIDRYLYVYHTGESFTIAWDAPTTTCDRTEMKLFHYEQNEDVLLPVALAKIPQPNNQITFNLPRFGHWIVSVRFCTVDDTCSDWSSSSDPTVSIVNSENKPWWIYTHVAPVTQ